MNLPSIRTGSVRKRTIHPTSADITPRRPPSSVSFAGCAWLVAYHFGVGASLQGRGWLEGKVLLGASSGALVAAALAAGLDAEHCYEETRACILRFAHRPLGPAGLMTAIVRDALERVLPEDAHERVHGRFFASVTELPSFRSHLMPNDPLRDKRDLVSLVLASCYIPLYYERPAFWRGRPYLDGGLRNNQPVLDASTLTVAPFRTVSPLRRKARSTAEISPQRQPSAWHSLLPSRSGLDALFEQGRRDADAYAAQGLPAYESAPHRT